MMVEQPNLKVLEKSFYSKFQEDGIWDILIGLFFLTLGLDKIFPFNEGLNSFAFGIIMGCVGPLYMVLKRKITRPRLGYVKFSINNLKKHRSSYISLALIFIAVVIMGIIAYFKIFSSEYSIVFFQEYKYLFFLLLSLILAAVAFMFNIKRFLGYAVMLMLLFSLGGLIQINKSYLFIVYGIMIMFSGIICLNRFIKKYPKLDATMESNGV